MFQIYLMLLTILCLTMLTSKEVYFMLDELKFKFCFWKVIILLIPLSFALPLLHFSMCNVSITNVFFSRYA